MSASLGSSWTTQPLSTSPICTSRDELRESGSSGIGTRWDRLKRAVANERPDVVVVTGDKYEYTSKRAFDNVKSYLLSLCQDAGLNPQAQLKVVPGNHDCRISGLGFAYRRNLFMSVFDEFLRPTLFNFTAPNRLNLELAILGMDTNDSGWLADGSVSEAELVRCEQFLEKVRAAYSIVLMHHHPAPVLKGEGPSEARIEPTMVLRNAGRVVDSLLGKGADLVLHGHKHWDGISQVSKPQVNKTWG